MAPIEEANVRRFRRYPLNAGCAEVENAVFDEFCRWPTVEKEFCCTQASDIRANDNDADFVVIQTRLSLDLERTRALIRAGGRLEGTPWRANFGFLSRFRLHEKERMAG